MSKIKAQVAVGPFGIQVGEMTVRTHKPAACRGQYCCIHRPSKHHMRKWPMNVRFDRQALVERLCSHGVGHPDPDSVAYFERHDFEGMGVHGCCPERCCTAP